MKFSSYAPKYARFIVGPGSAEVTESVASGSSQGPIDGTTVVGANAPSTTRVEASYIDDDLDKKIVMIRPQDTPIDTFTRSIANNESCKSWEAGGWEIGTREVVDQVDGAVLASATSIAVDNPDMWKPGDTFIVHSINNGADAGPLLDGSSNPVQCLIKSISSSTLTVQRVGTLSAALPAIPDNSFLYRLSPAVSELEASVEQTSRAEWAQKSENIRRDNEPDVTVEHASAEPEDLDEDTVKPEDLEVEELEDEDLILEADDNEGDDNEGDDNETDDKEQC